MQEIVVAVRQQRAWSSLVAWDLFLGGTGAGLFFLAQALTIAGVIKGPIGMVGEWLGLALAGAAALVLFAHLGVPSLFSRVWSRPDKSWVSRGAGATSLFAAFAFLTLLPSLPGLEALPWQPDTLAGAVLQWVALVLALALMAYTGLLASSWRSIPCWTTPFLRFIFVASSLLGATGTLLMVAAAMGNASFALTVMAMILILAVAILLALYLAGMHARGDATQRSVRFLLSGEESGAFIAGVLVVGLYVPFVLLATDVALALNSALLLFSAGVSIVIGTFQVCGSLLKAGAHREGDDGR